jgi:probable aminopeptidase NPEPL1
VTDFLFAKSPAKAVEGKDVVLFLAPQKRFREGWIEKALKGHAWTHLLVRAARETEAGPKGTTVSTLNPEGKPTKLVLGVLPDVGSRHNSPTRAEAANAAAQAACLVGKGAAVLACLEDPSHALAVAAAVGRSIPVFTRATGRKERPGPVVFAATDVSGKPIEISSADRVAVEQMRWAAGLVDTPTSEMHTGDFETAIRTAARGIKHLTLRVIEGKALRAAGLEGVHAVGRAARIPPRMVLLEYKPAKPRLKVGLVGKGIVYDTGGLSLKPTAGMSGMKADMAGAAAAVAATLALAQAGEKVHVICAAPLAENAIGPDAYRNDDILTLHSGKTVEINNTDAEGRLLLADAVSYVARKHKPDVVVDMATLTGAQLVATGIRHAAVVSNRAGLESLAIRVGRESGDLTWPLPFAPEFFQDEFKSKVADMKNSVGNRSNAQSSCAAQFVYSHVQDVDLPWLHIDLAGPAFRDERATGFGVALTVSLVRELDRKALAE